MRILQTIILLLVSGCIEYQPNTPMNKYTGPGNAQPLDSIWIEEVIPQVPTPDINLLFVIDNSCSMADDQIRLSREMPPMITELEETNVDYRIGIVDTDDGDPSLYTFQDELWIDRNTNDPISTFSNGVLLGTNGSGYEKGVLAIHEAFTNPINANFFRRDSPLHVFIVSDEPDSTTGKDNITSKDFWTALSIKEQLAGEMTFTTIANFTEGKECSAYQNPTRYMTLTRKYPGTLIELCSEDWSRSIRKITERISDLRYIYYLSEIPVLETLTIYIEENNIVYEFFPETDWIYDPSSNSVKFLEYKPGEGAIFTAIYMLQNSTNN